MTAKEVGDDFKVDDGASCNDAAAAYHAACQEYAPKAQEATSRWSDYQSDVFEDIALVMYGIEAWVLSKAAFVMRAICVLGAVPYGTEAVLALLERHPGRWPTSLSDRNDVRPGCRSRSSSSYSPSSSWPPCSSPTTTRRPSCGSLLDCLQSCHQPSGGAP